MHVQPADIDLPVSPARPLSESRRAARIPLWVKFFYTAFVIALIPVYWQYSPLTFLWFCNAALLITVAALWLENSLLASTQTLAIVIPHVIWQIDFVVQGATGRQIFAICGLVPANYMFDPDFPPLNRYFSLQHGWLLYFLLWVLWRLGYDRRALIVQTLYAWGLLMLSFLFTGNPDSPAYNINNVYGPGKTAQTLLHPWVWLLMVMILLPLLQYAPFHLLFRRIFRDPASPRTRAGSSPNT